MIIFIKSKRFQINIQTCNARDLADKIWDNFKDDVCIAYKSLQELDALTLDQSPVLDQAQLMESSIHAMQLSAGNVDGQSLGLTPSSEHIQQEQPQEQLNNVVESTLLGKFEELTSKPASLKQDIKNVTLHVALMDVHPIDIIGRVDAVLTRVKTVSPKRKGIRKILTSKPEREGVTNTIFLMNENRYHHMETQQVQ